VTPAAPPATPPADDPNTPVGATAAATEPATSLSDVVVTAQKREERAQDVPTSITVASGKQLLEENITTSNDVERLTPNLSGQQSSGRQSRARWFLRGVGTNDPSLNLESPIGVYQDDVFVAYSLAQTFPLFDLERVEILKGPQGTLWGKNTTGGAIHFISNKPGFKPSGYAKGTFGSYGLRGLEAAFGGPVIGQWLAARAAFFYEEQEGWATNLRDGSKAPQYTDIASRVQLLATVTKEVDVLLSARFRVLTGGTNAAYPVGVLPGGVIQQNPMNPDTFRPVYGDDPEIKDPFYGGLSNNSMRTAGVTATINWQLGDYTLTSITAADGVSDDGTSTTYQPVLSFNQTGTYSELDSRQITQELRLTSPREDRFNWILGFHYFNWNLFSDSRSVTFGPDQSRRSFINNRFLQNDISYAGFGSAKFNITEALGLTLGARYTYDRKYVEEQRLSGQGPGITFVDTGNWFDPGRVASVEPLTSLSLSPKKGWGQFTFDVTPEFRFTQDLFAYLRFARGFRAGVYNATILPPNSERGAVIPSANPEVLYDLEGGVKTEWLDDRLIANLALFHYWIDNVQLNVQQPNPNGLPNATGSTVQNAASGTVKGAELEIEALPVDPLRLRAGLGLLDARYHDFITYQGTERVDASDNAFYRVPQFSGSIGATLTLPVNETSAVGFGTDWIVRSLIYHNAVIQDDPVQTTPAYAIGNAEARFITGKGRFTLQGYVKNLTDESYKVFTGVVSSGQQTNNLGAPRTFGLQFIAQL
jgi:iron complex outermembrane receptor protein